MFMRSTSFDINKDAFGDEGSSGKMTVLRDEMSPRSVLARRLSIAFALWCVTPASAVADF